MISGHQISLRYFFVGNLCPQIKIYVSQDDNFFDHPPHRPRCLPSTWSTTRFLRNTFRWLLMACQLILFHVHKNEILEMETNSILSPLSRFLRSRTPHQWFLATLGGFLQQVFGSRRLLQATAVPTLLTWLVIIFDPQSLPCLLASRCHFLALTYI